jgi:hypothetical protein
MGAEGTESQPASSHISSHIACPVSRPLIACRCTGLRKQGLLDEQEFAEARKMLMRKWKKEEEISAWGQQWRQRQWRQRQWRQREWRQRQRSVETATVEVVECIHEVYPPVKDSASQASTVNCATPVSVCRPWTLCSQPAQRSALRVKTSPHEPQRTMRHGRPARHGGMRRGCCIIIYYIIKFIAKCQVPSAKFHYQVTNYHGGGADYGRTLKKRRTEPLEAQKDECAISYDIRSQIMR